MKIFLKRDLEGNRITLIDVGAFNGLSALQYLYLHFNEITRIDVGAFNGLSALQHLYLFDNKITRIDVGAFNGLSALHHLYLNLNKITRIDVGAFNGLSALQYLYLHFNEITRIDVGAFNGLSALQHLYLFDNKITRIDVGAFNGLSALQRLNLNRNEITRIDVGAFNGLSALQYLYLRHNQITTLDINLFNNLTALSNLYLDNNPLDCSTCELEKLKKLLRNLINSTASCDNTPLIDHIFTNCKESVTTKAFQSSVATDSSARTTESISDINMIKNTEVNIYLSCGVGFFFILSCSMACFYVVKKYRSNQNLGINQIIDINNREAELDSETQRSPTISSERGSGYGYAEIDELEMSEFILTPSEQPHLVQDDNSNDSYDRISSPSNDYLNPYESLLPSLQQSGNDQNDSDEYSNPNEENRAYDNLYQPIRFNRQDEFRQYASCSSVHYFEVLDDPIGKENDESMKEDSKQYRKTW